MQIQLFAFYIYIYIYIYIYMSSAHNLCKQIGLRTGPTKCQSFIGPDLNPICLTLRMIFLIEFFKIIDFEKKISR